MTYLVFQLILLLLACTALGFFLAWLIWGWRRAEMMELAASDRVLFHDAAAEVEGLQAQLATLEGERAAAVTEADEARRQMAATVDSVQRAEGESTTAHREVGRLRRELAECAQARASADAALSAARGRIAALESDLASNGASGVTAAARANGSAPRASFASLSDVEEGEKPPVLTEAPAGGGDDLKRISGVGQKLEGVLKDLGVYTFEQIAGWTDKEIAWVDEHLKFRGRVQRDNWIEQARLLAEGGETAFSKRVDKGGVYE
ncbi:MAG: hypothetical protein KTR21_11270 [Rhodobacteraceae bacterium]|nr:hypothetical protein [Paracoccaceae bacterium]